MEELNLNEIVKIEQMPKVFEQLELIGTYVDEQLKDLDKLECTEKNKQEVKKRRTDINNFKSLFENKRKEIKNKINEPYEQFNKKYEETIKSKIDDAYGKLTEKINKIENEQKLKKKNEVERYFIEYAASKDIDFIKFEQLNLNITLNVSEKSLKEQVKGFLDKIVDDLNLIVTQEHNQEILLEYKKSLNVSSAISTVLNRYRELEEQKKREELKTQREAHVQESIQRVEEVIAPPIKTENQVEEFLEISFKVRGSREKLKTLVNYLKDGEYEYEQC